MCKNFINCISSYSRRYAHTVTTVALAIIFVVLIVLCFYWRHDHNTVALLVPGMVAVIVAYIGLLQWKTNEERNKLELFDKRYQLFEVVSKHFRFCHSYSDIESRNAADELGKILDQAYFLLDKKAYDFIDEFRKKLNDDGYIKDYKIGSDSWYIERIDQKNFLPNIFLVLKI